MAERILGSVIPVTLPSNIKASGFLNVKSSIFSGAGFGVTRLTKTNMILMITNNQKDCIIYGIPHNSVITFTSPKAGKSIKNTTAPRMKPEIIEVTAASLVPLLQKTPQINTTAIGGERTARIWFIASKMLINLSITGDQAIARTITMAAVHLPIRTCC